MKIGKLKNELGWNYGVEIRGVNHNTLRWAPQMAVWCFKLIKMVEEGGAIQKGVEFKGIWWTFLPIEWFYGHSIWKIRTIVVPINRFTRRLHKWGIIRHAVYRFSYPIKIKL